MGEISPAIHVRAQPGENEYFLKKLGHFSPLPPKDCSPKERAHTGAGVKCNDEGAPAATAQFPSRTPALNKESEEFRVKFRVK